MAKTEGDPLSPVIDRVLAPKPHALLAAQLREAILSGEIGEGSPLPSERELVDQSGLTRGAVREALKTLASEGLVETKPGRFGGNFVTLPGRESLTVSLSQFIRGRQLPLRTLHETRLVLEPALARLAATYRTDADLERLRQLHEALIEASDNFQTFSRANIKWHTAVAAASHNDLLIPALEAISYGVVVSTTVDEYDTPETRAAVMSVHGEILAAIETQDADLAERRMRQHIAATHSRAANPDSVIAMSDARE